MISYGLSIIIHNVLLQKNNIERIVKDDLLIRKEYTHHETKEPYHFFSLFCMKSNNTFIDNSKNII